MTEDEYRAETQRIFNEYRDKEQIAYQKYRKVKCGLDGQKTPEELAIDKRCRKALEDLKRRYESGA